MVDIAIGVNIIRKRLIPNLSKEWKVISQDWVDWRNIAQTRGIP